MKIGIDARCLCTAVRKGIGTYLQNLLKAMVETEPNNEYMLYTSRPLGNVANTPQIVDRPISIPAGERLFLWEQVRLPLELGLRRVDVFHSPANTTPLFKASPTVVTVHDTKLLEMSFASRAERFYHQKLQRAAVRGARKIICPSQYSKRCVMREFGAPESQVEVIYQGISGDFRVLSNPATIADVTTKYGISRPYVLFAGGESPAKNISRLIVAFALLRQRKNLGLQLVIPGIRMCAIRDQHTAEVEQHGLSGSVRLLEFVDANDLVALYNGATLFVYPSLSEGFGFPPLEAMACGVPVTASNATSIPEVVGDAALLFDGTDVPNMAETMYRALTDDGLRNELREKGLQRVKQFRWSDTARTTLEIYRAALDHYSSGDLGVAGGSQCTSGRTGAPTRVSVPDNFIEQ